MTQHLGPTMLTDEYKKSNDCIYMCICGHIQIFSHILTGEEMWILYINVESKQQSRQWCNSSFWKPKNSNKPSKLGRQLGSLSHCFLGQGRCPSSGFKEQDQQSQMVFTVKLFQNWGVQLRTCNMRCWWRNCFYPWQHTEITATHMLLRRFVS